MHNPTPTKVITDKFLSQSDTRLQTHATQDRTYSKKRDYFSFYFICTLLPVSTDQWRHFDLTDVQLFTYKGVFSNECIYHWLQTFYS